MTLERGRGCTGCRETGFRGRTGIFELHVVTDRVRAELARTLDAGALRDVAVSDGMTTLQADGWRAVRAGITTVEEVLRVVEA